MKFLNESGVQLLWTKVKEKINAAIKENVTDKLGAASGIATLDSDSKLTASQLPSLKTVNGESIVGTGNISIDLGIYQIVESLPESNQNPNKIYLVLTKPATGQEQDVYTEYAWINNKWEKFGEYKAEVDLADYLKTSELEEKLKEVGDFVTFDDVVSESKNGLVPKGWYQILYQLNESTRFLKSLQDTPETTKTTVTIKGTAVDRTGTVNSSASTTIKAASATAAGVMTSEQFEKLNAINDEATKDEAITTEDLEKILV